MSAIDHTRCPSTPRPDTIALRKARLLKLKKRPLLIDCHTHVGVSYSSYLNYGYPYAMSFEDLVVRMDRLGVDVAVVFPSSSSYYGTATKPAAGTQTGGNLSRFPYERENLSLFTEIFDVFPEYADRALPFVRFDPSRQAEEQVAQFEELLSRRPIYGMKTVTSYTQSFLADLEGPGRCLLDFARRRDLPILMHTSYLKTDPWASVFDAVAIAERNPDIRFCLAHSARFTRPVLERAHAIPNAFVDVSAFDIHCRLARSNSSAIPPEGPERLPADYTDPAAVLRTLAASYPGTILWGTDMPCNYFIRETIDGEGTVRKTWLKSSFEVEGRILRKLPPEQVEQIGYRNTLAFLFG